LAVIEFLTAERPRALALQKAVQAAAAREPPLVPRPATRDGSSLAQGPRLRPAITSVTPIVMPVCGATPVTVVGRDFDSKADVLIGGTKCVVVVRHPPGEIVVLSPPARHDAPTTGVSVAVRNTNGEQDVLENILTYLPVSAFDQVADGLPESAAAATLSPQLAFKEGVPPTLDGVVPAVCPLVGGTVQLLGANFAPEGMIVEVDSTVIADVAVMPDGRAAVFNSPPMAAGQHSIRVTNPDGLSAVLENILFYLREAPLPSPPALPVQRVVPAPVSAPRQTAPQHQRSLSQPPTALHRVWGKH